MDFEQKELTPEEAEDIFAKRLARLFLEQINDEHESRIKRDRKT